MGKSVLMLWGCTSLCQAGVRGTLLDESRGLRGAGRATDPSRDAWKVETGLSSEDPNMGHGSDSPKATVFIWIRSFTSC